MISVVASGSSVNDRSGTRNRNVVSTATGAAGITTVDEQSNGSVAAGETDAPTSPPTATTSQQERRTHAPITASAMRASVAESRRPFNGPRQARRHGESCAGPATGPEGSRAPEWEGRRRVTPGASQPSVFRPRRSPEPQLFLVWQPCGLEAGWSTSGQPRKLIYAVASSTGPLATDLALGVAARPPDRPHSIASPRGGRGRADD